MPKHNQEFILYTIILPLTYNDGSHIQTNLLRQAEEELPDRASGLSCYDHGIFYRPGRGVYRKSGTELQKDVIQPLHVVLPADPQEEARLLNWKSRWERKLNQDWIFIVAQSVRVIKPKAELAEVSRDGLLAELTPREFEVLELVAKGKKNKEIAQALWIEESTVQNHLHHVYEKLGVSSRTEAAMIFVQENGNRSQN